MKKTILLAALSGTIAMNINAQKQTFDPSFLDKTVTPATDFNQFANGTWIKNNPVPKSESRWGSFNELQRDNYVKIEKIFEQLKKSKAREKETANLSNYYQSYISSSREQKDYQGLKTLQETLSLIQVGNGAKSAEFAKSVALLHTMGIDVFFSLYIEQDLTDNTLQVPYLSQPRLGLPNKTYYEGEKLQKYEKTYLQYIRSLAKGTSIVNGKNIFSDKVFKLEHELAQNMFSPEELRDISKSYNPMETAKLQDLVAAFDWPTYFKTLGLDPAKTKFFVVSQMPYFKALNEFFSKQDPQMLAEYMQYNVVNSLAPYLNNLFVDMHFDFYQKYLLGKQEKKEIHEEAIDNITMLPIGHILGKHFVKAYFGEEATAKVNTLVDNLFVAFKERIEGLTWMSNETKKQALVKLSSFTRKLAYPEKWKDFSSLEDLTADNLTANILAVRKFSTRDNLNQLGQPIDKLKWEMPAHMVNAYYNPLQNEIVFPAGIMQAPFFDVNYEDAVNYARMGMVIGHELTHGFDDQGAQFTADGRFQNWWTDEDKKKFEELTKTYGETFANFCPFEGICVNPNLTMGENIADLGGITLAFHAYMLTDEYKRGEKIHGYTPAQRFFISYAQIWKTTYTDEELKNRIENDPHSPGMYRVNGPLMNTPDFFEAFKIKENEPMRNKKGKMTVIW